MHIVLIAIDKPDTLQTRLDNRDAHLAYVAQSGCVELAGPFLDGNGQMCGSMLILALDTMADAEKWAENDPYAQAGLLESITLREWKKVIG